MSHIVGHKTRIGNYNYPHEVLDYYKNNLKEKYGPFDYYVIGGSDCCKYVFENTLKELDRRRIVYKTLDALGHHYRRVKIDPINRTVTLYKKRLYEAINPVFIDGKPRRKQKSIR